MQKDHIVKKEELRMYNDIIDYVNEVQVKICERIKFDSVKID